MKSTVLILDDVLQIREDLSRNLRKEGYAVVTAGLIQEANKLVQTLKIDFAIIDLKIDYSGDYGGIKEIENINKTQPRTKTIVLTGYGENPEVKEKLEKVNFNAFVPKGGEENYINLLSAHSKTLSFDLIKLHLVVL